jgi:hypothetical protein
MIAHLMKENVEFWPSQHGYEERNFTLKLNDKQLEHIKKEAFYKSHVPTRIMDYIINKTLASGVCSGISCYTLGKFYGEGFSWDDPRQMIAILQVRTWGRDFLLQAVYSYFLSREKVLQKISSGIDAKSNDLPVLLVFLPKIFNLKNITFAHTVLPFRWREGLANIYISLFDSNYPGDDGRVLIYNKFTHCWSYDGKNSQQWVISINYPENLTRKVPFLI